MIRWLLIVVIAGSAGACGREKPSSSTATVTRQLRFDTATAVPGLLQELAADRTRLWITTYAGVISVDPVAERWTAVYADSQALGQSQLVPCDGRIWLVVGRDTLLLADAEAQKFEVRTRAHTAPPHPAPQPLILARCAPAGVWVLDGASLFYMPLAGGTTSRYEVPPLGERASVRDFVDGGTSGLYFLAYVPGPTGPFALARFDTAAKTNTRIELPTGAGTYGLNAVERVDNRVLVRTYGQRVFSSEGSGPPWTEVPPMRGLEPDMRGGPTVLARENGVVWVGASYDVSPASYFVLRYIKDAKEPQDLVVLPDYYTQLRSQPRKTVQHLGMLWIVSDSALLRIDPSSGELVRYRPRPGGVLDKQSFRITEEKGVLRYFSGDSLFTLGPDGIPPEPREASDTAASDTTDQASPAPDSLPPAQLSKKPKR